MRIMAIMRDMHKDADGDWVVDFSKTPTVTYSETLRERTETIRRVAQYKGWTTLEVENALDAGESVYVNADHFYAIEYKYVS